MSTANVIIGSIIKVIYKPCPICTLLSEKVDYKRGIYICPRHGQWSTLHNGSNAPQGGRYQEFIAK